MKKRFLAFLLAVCVAVSMLVLPASAVGSNAAVQTATALGGLTAEQAGSLGAPLTRGQAARLLTAFSAYRDTTTAQGRTGRLYSDVDSDSPYAVYIRTAVQNGWMTGYSDGSFRPDNTVTLEEACTMALRLLGYDVAKLGGTFPTAQLSKASALGLRNEINARQGETLTLEQGTVLFYNALTAMNGSGQVYASYASHACQVVVQGRGCGRQFQKLVPVPMAEEDGSPVVRFGHGEVATGYLEIDHGVFRCILHRPLFSAGLVVAVQCDGV